MELAARLELINEPLIIGAGIIRKNVGVPHPKTGPAKSGVFWLLKLSRYLVTNSRGVKSPSELSGRNPL
jgi:hypothetical protein